MGWGILPIPKSLLLSTNELPRRIPEVLSREKGVLTHSLNYSLVTDPSTDSFIHTPDKHYDRDKIDSVVLPGVPYTKRMLYNLDLLSNSEFVDDDDFDDEDGNIEENWDNDDAWHFDMTIDPVTNQVCVGDSAYPYFRNNPELMTPVLAHVKSREKGESREKGDSSFEVVDLASGFFQSMVVCPGTSQTWPARDLSCLLGILRHSMRHCRIHYIPLNLSAGNARPLPGLASHASIESEADIVPWVGAAGAPFDPYAEDDGEEYDDEEEYDEEEEEYEEEEDDFAFGNGTHEPATKDNTTLGHSWDELERIASKYVFFQTLSSGAQMFSVDTYTALYQVDDVTKFTTDEPASAPANMVDMGLPFHRCSMVHFIPEISLIVVGKMQGQVVLLRPLKNNLIQTSHYARERDRHQDKLAEDNYPEWAFRTEWTLPLQKDRTDDKYPRCCLLGIAVSRIPEPGAGKYALQAEAKPAETQSAGGESEDPPDKYERLKSQGRRWRLIMYYMDHTVLQYHIEESDAGSDMCSVLPVLQEAQQASRMRQQADPSRPTYQDGVRVA